MAGIGSKKSIRVVAIGAAVGLALGALAQTGWLPLDDLVSKITPGSIPNIFHMADHRVCARVESLGNTRSRAIDAFASQENWEIYDVDSNPCNVNVHIFANTTDVRMGYGRGYMTSMTMYEPGNGRRIFTTNSIGNYYNAAFNPASSSIINEYERWHDGGTPTGGMTTANYRDGGTCLRAHYNSSLNDIMEDRFASMGLRKIEGRCATDLRLIALSTPIENLLSQTIGYGMSVTLVQEHGDYHAGQSLSMAASERRAAEITLDQFERNYRALQEYERQGR